MAFDPTSRDRLPEKHVRALISRSETWQTWTGTANATDALAFVHYEENTDPANDVPPWAIVAMEEGSQSSELRALGDHEIRGRVMIRFIGDVDETKDLDEQLGVFEGNVSDVKEEMVLDARTYGFRLDSAVFVDKAMLAGIEDKKSRGAYAFAMVAIGYVD